MEKAMKKIKLLKMFIVLMFVLACLVDAGTAAAVTTNIFITSVNCAIDNRSIGGSSIRISGTEYSEKKDGLNIVVYDLNKFQVTKTSAFSNTNSKEYSTYFNKIPTGSLVLITSQLLCSKDSSMDLKIQKSNLHGLNKLGFDIGTIAPLHLRSAVYVFCKGQCDTNVTLSIDLPYQAMHHFNEDPIMLSFLLDNNRLQDYVTQSSDNDNKSKKILLSTVISCCCVLILASIFTMVLIWYRKYHTETKKFKNHHIYHSTPNSIDGFNSKRKVQCELIHCSMDDYNTKYEMSTSAKMLKRHNMITSTSNEQVKMFATYVKVDNGGGDDCIYKLPSGVSKHEPPSRAPSGFLKPSNIQASCSTIDESYIEPHEYANPGEKLMDGYEVSAHDINNTDFIEEIYSDYAEYETLEPYPREEYVVPDDQPHQIKW